MKDIVEEGDNKQVRGGGSDIFKWMRFWGKGVIYFECQRLFRIYIIMEYNIEFYFYVLSDFDVIEQGRLLDGDIYVYDDYVRIVKQVQDRGFFKV